VNGCNKLFSVYGCTKLAVLFLQVSKKHVRMQKQREFNREVVNVDERKKFTNFMMSLDVYILLEKKLIKSLCKQPQNYIIYIRLN